MVFTVLIWEIGSPVPQPIDAGPLVLFLSPSGLDDGCVRQVATIRPRNRSVTLGGLCLLLDHAWIGFLRQFYQTFDPNAQVMLP